MEQGERSHSPLREPGEARHGSVFPQAQLVKWPVGGLEEENRRCCFCLGELGVAAGPLLGKEEEAS